jgi:nucleoside-diphosphate-sugar epimerase
MQADSIVRAYKSMRIASLRLHWSVPDKSIAYNPGGRASDLWGYVQEDSAADAFLLAIEDSKKWTGHERFFIASSQTAYEEDTMDLIKHHWPGVPIRQGKTLVGNQGIFDCSKAAELLGWQHTNGLTMKTV